MIFPHFYSARLADVAEEAGPQERKPWRYMVYIHVVIALPGMEPASAWGEATVDVGIPDWDDGENDRAHYAHEAVQAFPAGSGRGKRCGWLTADLAALVDRFGGQAGWLSDLLESGACQAALCLHTSVRRD